MGLQSISYDYSTNYWDNETRYEIVYQNFIK